MTRLCPVCHQQILNEGAHAEACPGPMVFAGWQCSRCLATVWHGELYCACGGKKWPTYRVKREDEARA